MSVRDLFCAVIFAVLSVPACAGEMIPSTAFGKDYLFTINQDALDQTPSWTDDAENPPLSARKAIMLADELASKLIPTPKGMARRMTGAKVTRGSVRASSTSKKWYWIVHYVWNLDPGGSSGIPDHLNVIVLMDGTVVEPEIRERKRVIRR